MKSHLWCLTVCLLIAGCGAPVSPGSQGVDPGAAPLWATSTTGLSSSRFLDVAAGDGSVYAVGFVGNNDTGFGNGVEATGTTSAGSSLLVKYNSEGKALWARALSYSTGESRYTGVAVASDGSVYVSGYITSGIYQLGNNVSVTGANAFNNALVAKYSPDGVAQWARVSSSTTTSSYCTYAGLTTVGEAVYVVGTLTAANAVFTFGNGLSITLPNVVYTYPLLAKYQTDGTPVQVATLSSQATSATYFNAVAADSDANLYISGTIYGTGTQSLSASVHVAGNDINNNGLLAKYNSSLVPQWARTSRAGTRTSFADVALDGSENAYVAGSYFGTAEADFGTEETAVTAQNSDSTGENPLIVKYDSSGNALWAKTSQETAEGSLSGLTVKGSQVYAVGWVKGVSSMRFGPSVSTQGTYYSGRNLLQVQWNAQGTAQGAWSTKEGNSSSQWSSVTHDAAGGLLGAGYIATSNLFVLSRDQSVSGGSTSGANALLARLGSL